MTPYSMPLWTILTKCRRRLDRSGDSPARPCRARLPGRVSAAPRQHRERGPQRADPGGRRRPLARRSSGSSRSRPTPRRWCRVEVRIPAGSSSLERRMSSRNRSCPHRRSCPRGEERHELIERRVDRGRRHHQPQDPRRLELGDQVCQRGRAAAEGTFATSRPRWLRAGVSEHGVAVAQPAPRHIGRHAPRPTSPTCMCLDSTIGEIRMPRESGQTPPNQPPPEGRESISFS